MEPEPLGVRPVPPGDALGLAWPLAPALLLPLVPALPEPEVVAPEPEPIEPDPVPPDDAPVELEDLLKCWSHSDRETWPSLFLSTDEKLGAELLEALLPPEPLDPVLADPEDLLLLLAAPDDPLEDLSDEPVLLAPCEEDGVLADEPLLDLLSPAPTATVAKPRKAAVTAALINFNVM